MAKRIFGAIRAAGVRVEEQEGSKTISPGELGVAGFAMLAEKGPTGKYTFCGDRTTFDRIYGGIISEGQGPDCARDYFELAQGAGGIAVLRITDGNEVASSRILYARDKDKFVQLGLVSAKNGGRWGGKYDRKSDNLAASSALTNTTLQLPAGMVTAISPKTDQFKGGYIELDAVANKRYLVTASTSAGLLTVATDQTMKDDWTAAAAPTNLRFYLTLDNDGKALAVRIGDGEENPTTEFSVTVYVDGSVARKFGNLHTDPLHPRYWANLINNDPSNHYITVTDTFTGSHTAAARPANLFRNVATVTTDTLTLLIHQFVINSPGGGNPTMVLGATTDAHLEQDITITMSSPTAGTAVSDKFGALGSVTLGTLFNATPANKWVPPFTITAGASPLVATDTLVIRYRPLRASGLVDGTVFPRKQANPRTGYRIKANTHKTVQVVGGIDLTAAPHSVVTGDSAMIEFNAELGGGRDGNADITDTHYTNAWDAILSPFNNLDEANMGLVKFSTPGVTSTTVQKAGIAYADARNHQYRTLIPNNVTDENAALDYINATIGRSEYQKVFWPSFGDVADPDPAAAREGKLKTVCLVGMILGREARIAADYQGYHKAEAGITAKLPKLLRTALGDRKLNEEILNPAGINVIKKKRGNYVLWGDRTPAVDSNWKFAHHREQMSYYEHVLLDQFDFTIFDINDAESDMDAQTSLTEFFRPEFTKRAIRGKDLQEAAIIKVDSELNTDASRAEGDKIASVMLRLADVTERFIIRIGKQGVFEQVG